MDDQGLKSCEGQNLGRIMAFLATTSMAPSWDGSTRRTATGARLSGTRNNGVK